jgi:Antirestriction protein
MLPRHFGRDMLTVEYAIFAFMRKLSSRYTGGYWTYNELSNGGFYMAPQSDSRFPVNVENNGFEGEMSADAAGITACCSDLSRNREHRNRVTAQSVNFNSRSIAWKRASLRRGSKSRSLGHCSGRFILRRNAL